MQDQLKTSFTHLKERIEEFSTMTNHFINEKQLEAKFSDICKVVKDETAAQLNIGLQPYLQTA